jgi:prepilin peptidase CpaA
MAMTPILALVAAGLLLYAAWHDLAARTVPNWLPVLLVCLGIGLRLVDHHLLAALVIGVVTFVILFGVWLLGAMGGGDVKLWAATALLIPPGLQPDINFFFTVVLIGGALALVYYGLSWILRPARAAAAPGAIAEGAPAHLPARVWRAEIWRIRKRAPLPYALAIAGGALLTFLPLSFQR